MEGKYRMIFFVDGDNLPTTGTNGIRLLDSEDEVHIFYATNNQFFSGAKKEAINQSSRCKVTYTAIPKAPNAVDFAIAVELAKRCACSEEDNRRQMYMLVSGDNHFDVIVSELKRCYGRSLSVCRVVSVEEGYSRFFMTKVTSLRSFHEILQHQLGTEMGHTVYLNLKQMFADEATRAGKRRETETAKAKTDAETAEGTEDELLAAGAAKLKLVKIEAASCAEGIQEDPATDETLDGTQIEGLPDEKDIVWCGEGEELPAPPKKRSRRRRSRHKKKRQTEGEISDAQQAAPEEQQHEEEEVVADAPVEPLGEGAASRRSAFGFARALLAASDKRG